MSAKIYRPSKNAMQSGRAALDYWILEYEAETPRSPDPLMGWTSAEDTLPQVRLKFESREAAEAFARSEGLNFSVSKEHERRVNPRSYLDNFKFRPFEESQ